MIELGCGNGRDSLYFASEGLQVHGIDQCDNAIEQLNSLGTNAHFSADDFTQLSADLKSNHVYSRFTLHSVDKESADNTIKWAAEAIDGGYLAIEVRSVKDELFGQGTEVGVDTWKTDHSRRFVRKEDLLDIIRNNNMEIVFEQESKGLAIYKTEDPVVIRVVAKKKS